MTQGRLVGRTLACMWLLLVTAGCDRASRYPATFVASAPTSPVKKVQLNVPGHFGWLPTERPHDIPIIFVHADSQAEEWGKLPEFWNRYPPMALGTRTIHLGQSPLGAAAGLFVAEQLEMVKIKVPLGLPDPTPEIPDANPLTLPRWRLGKKLFYDPTWFTAEGEYSCASCHNPYTGFTEHERPQRVPRMNAPSLINCVYNKHQFWDGRVAMLEEVLERQLEDELPPTDSDGAEASPVKQHVWTGFIQRLKNRRDYVDSFQTAFGIAQPTIDATAKALGVYMRTILSGNSLFDQAKKLAAKDGSKDLTADHFKPLLTEKVLKSLQREKDTERNVSRELQSGYELFFSRKTRCTLCHYGWNFTDNSFHNIGIRESDFQQDPVQKPNEVFGRFRWLPLGLKDARMVGAFKTPSLRALPRTAPYFHDGHYGTIEQAVQYYNQQIRDKFNNYLDPVLKDESNRVLPLDLSDDNILALTLFLRSLDGDPIPAVLAAPPPS